MRQTIIIWLNLNVTTTINRLERIIPLGQEVTIYHTYGIVTKEHMHILSQVVTGFPLTGVNQTLLLTIITVGTTILG